jgi:hypothetical protein
LNKEQYKAQKVGGVLEAMNAVTNLKELENLRVNIIPVLIKGLPLEDIKYLRTMYLSRKQNLIDEGKPYDDNHLRDEYRKSVKDQLDKETKPNPKEDFYETEEIEATEKPKPKAVEKNNQVG